MGFITSFKDLSLVAVTTVAALGAAGTAFGATLNVTYQESSVFGTPDLSSSLRISSPGYSGVASAGPFRLVGDGGFGDFIAFCIDLATYMTSGADYTLSDASLFGAATDENIDRLFTSAYAGVDTAVEGAAFQVALWEIITDTGAGLDLAAGDFTADWNPDVIAQASEYLDGLAGAATGGFKLTFLQSDLSQDLVTISPVPVPAAMGMLGLGLAGLFGLKRRQKKAAAA